MLHLMHAYRPALRQSVKWRFKLFDKITGHTVNHPHSPLYSQGRHRQKGERETLAGLMKSSPSRSHSRGAVWIPPGRQPPSLSVSPSLSLEASACTAKHVWVFHSRAQIHTWCLADNILRRLTNACNDKRAKARGLNSTYACCSTFCGTRLQTKSQTRHTHEIHKQELAA